MVEARLERAAVVLQEAQALAGEFRAQCASVVSFFSDAKNLAHVFGDHPTETSKNSEFHCLTYKQLQQQLGSKDGALTYSSPDITNLLKMLTHYILCSVLVEVNAEHLLCPTKPSNSFAFRDLIYHIGNKDLRDTLFASLAPHYKVKDNQPPKSFHEFIQGLDHTVLRDLLSSLSTDPAHFNSLPIFRELFMYFKSGDSLALEDSDCAKSISHNNHCIFSSSVVDDSSYISAFESIFDQYLPATYLESLLSVCRILLQPGKTIPTPITLGYLMDKFGDLGLLHYQSLVYSVLPGFRHNATVLADIDSQPAPLGAFHLEHLVSEQPNFLASLFKYVALRDDVATFQQLLAFWRLPSIIVQEKTLNRSNLSSMLSMSRFTKSKERQDNVESLVFATDEPLYVQLDTLCTCIESCIELGQFQYIDLLMNKLLLHSVEPTDPQNHQILIALSFGSDIANAVNIALNGTPQNAPYSLIISNPYSPKELAAKLYNKRLYKLLLRASEESNDMGRVLWLIPHLDEYVRSALLDADPLNCVHMEAIKRFIVDPSTAGENFEAEDEKASVDMQLISDIYRVLSKFGLEGKLLAYDQLLSFNQTIAFSA